MNSGDSVTMTINEVREAAARVGTTHEELLALAHKLAAQARRSVCVRLDIGQLVFRVTSYHTAIPERLSEVLYPTSPGIGRANRPGKPVFYASLQQRAAFLELHAEPGQYVVLTKWRTLAPANLHGIGYSAEAFARAGARRSPPEPFGNFEARIDDRARHVREFLAEEFTRPGTAGYPLTAALAEVHMAGDEVSGIVYPAVAGACDFDNIALQPAFVDAHLSLVEAEVIRVDRASTGADVEGAIVATLVSVDHGELRWKYSTSSATAVPPGASAIVEFGPGHTSWVAERGCIEVDGLRFDVQPGFRMDLDGDDVRVRDLQGRVVPPVAGTRKLSAPLPAHYEHGIAAYLGTFEELFSLATIAIPIDSTPVMIGICKGLSISSLGQAWTLTSRRWFGFEMHAALAPSKRVAWMMVLQRLSAETSGRRSVAVVVDAAPGELEDLNARAQPIFGDYLLPEGFELVYGSVSCEENYPNNAAISAAYSAASEVLDKVRSKSIAPLTATAGSSLYQRFRRFETTV